MDTVAILVDGGFYTRRAKHFSGTVSGKDAADLLEQYCHSHLYHKESGTIVRDRLYRIFYYDCPPLDHNVYHPLLKKSLSLKQTDLYAWKMEFQNALYCKRKFALRLGKLASEHAAQYTLKPEIVKKLLSGSIQLSELTVDDFKLNITQKGVDMRIGLDISSMAYKKQVSKIILISGDSDFVPAAKTARREGIDFVLDPMGATINADLNEHIDGIMSPKFPTPKTITT